MNPDSQELDLQDPQYGPIILLLNSLGNYRTRLISLLHHDAPNWWRNVAPAITFAQPIGQKIIQATYIPQEATTSHHSSPQECIAATPNPCQHLGPYHHILDILNSTIITENQPDTLILRHIQFREIQWASSSPPSLETVLRIGKPHTIDLNDPNSPKHLKELIETPTNHFTTTTSSKNGRTTWL